MTEGIHSSRLRGVLGGFYALQVMFLYLPLVLLITFSFNDSITPALPLRGFTTRWYREFLSSSDLIRALIASVIVAGTTSLLAVTLATPLTLGLVRESFRGRAVVVALLIAPLVVPLVVLGVSLLVLMRLAGLSLSLATVVVAHTVIVLPYAVLILAPRLLRLDPGLEEAARDLGASRAQATIAIILPLLAPAIISAAMVSFVISFDEYVLASFLAGDQPTYPVYLYSQLRFARRLPVMLAVASLVVLVTAMLGVLGTSLRRVRE